MLVGLCLFETIPGAMLSVFTKDPLVIDIGSHALRVIGLSFVPIVPSLLFPVFFQAVGCPIRSSCLTVLRTVALFVPVAALLAQIGGLSAFWYTFPITDGISALVGAILFFAFSREQKRR